MTNYKTNIWLLRPVYWGVLTFLLLAPASVFIFWPFNHKPANNFIAIGLPLLAVWIVSIVIIVYISNIPGRLQTASLKKFVVTEKSEIRNRTIVSALPDMIFIIDRDGYYVDFNIPPSRQDLVNPSNFLFKNVSDFLSESLAEQTMNYIHRVLQTGESFSHYYQLQVEDDLRSYESRFVPHSKNDVMALVRDTTEMKNAEQRILESESKYRALFEQGTESIFISTLQGNFLLVNPAGCKISQYTEDELLTMRFHDLVDNDELKTKPFQLVEIASGKTIISERKMRRKDGEFIDVELSTHMMAPNRLLCFVRDITERKKVQRDLEASRESLRQLTNYVESLREAERLNISREIHEDLGQRLAVLKMDMSRLAKKTAAINSPVNNDIRELVNSIDAMIDRVRKISFELRPGMLDDMGLMATLEWYCEDFAKRTGISASFDSELPDEKLPQELTISLFRIFQESLVNIARHAEAKNVDVSIRREDQRLVLIIRDNGKGFDLSASRQNKTLGIRIMTERALKLKGTYNITSYPGSGTIVEVCIPYNYKPRNEEARNPGMEASTDQ